jgi:hypothetical protein
MPNPYQLFCLTTWYSPYVRQSIYDNISNVDMGLRRPKYQELKLEVERRSTLRCSATRVLRPKRRLSC